MEAISVAEEGAGILPKGTYVTVVTSRPGEAERKSVLKVVESKQVEVYSPSPLIADLESDSEEVGIEADNKCKNLIKIERVFDIGDRTDGKIDFIRPRSKARPSNADEISKALQLLSQKGPRVFAATVFGTKNSKLRADGELLAFPFPEEFYWHQSQIAGATGSGKTVALKYLALNFSDTKFVNSSGAQEAKGAVVVINVKDQDFLKMDYPSEISSPEILEEWQYLSLKPKRHLNFEVWCNGYNTKVSSNLIKKGVTQDAIQPVTLRAQSVRAESLVSLVRHLTPLQQQSLPDMFRYWQDFECTSTSTMGDFVDFISERRDAGDNDYPTLNIAGKKGETSLHKGQINSILNKLNSVTKYFDAGGGAQDVSAKKVLTQGKITAIDLTDDLDFGAVVLNQLLRDIQLAKDESPDLPPVLIIIDEVHKFYGVDSSNESLAILDEICRVGRSKQIGIIFASQEPSDIPKGLENVTNSKFYFKSPTSPSSIRDLASRSELANLRPGYCVARVHNLPNLTCMKFPMSPSGVMK